VKYTSKLQTFLKTPGLSPRRTQSTGAPAYGSSEALDAGVRAGGTAGLLAAGADGLLAAGGGAGLLAEGVTGVLEYFARSRATSRTPACHASMTAIAHCVNA
jgi:hypothetical protein